MRKPSTKGKTTKTTTDRDAGDDKVDLARFLSRKAVFQTFELWIVGETPLIVHNWSEKARREMFEKQIGVLKPGREKRDPVAEFMASLYDLGDGRYGFPATGVKKCILSAAHKDKGIPRDTVMRNLWINAPFVRTRPALETAICDLPLLLVYGSAPEMREDMVRVGVGLRKTASLAWRGQFSTWAVRVKGRFNASVLTVDMIAALISEAGLGCGIGEWRNEKNGMFGAFRLADTEESKDWDRFAAGKGPLPKPRTEFLQAAE